MLGFSGAAYKHVRLVAADGGPGAPHGKIVGLAASPDGLTLAVAEAEPGRIEIVVRYVISNGGQNSVAVRRQFPRGERDLGRARHARRGPGCQARRFACAGWRLYRIHVLGAVTVEQVKLSCPPSMLVFSPDARLRWARATSIRRRRSSTEARELPEVSPDRPIRVLGWAPEKGAFLYSAPAGRGHGAGVFRYNIADGKTELVAASSSAAAYTGEGIVMALGNRDLKPQRPRRRRRQAVTAQLASFVPRQGKMIVDSLEFPRRRR